MKNLYDEDYFERGIETKKSCYTNYRWIPELTIPLAFRLIEYLQISPTEKILDFGCAKGYLVKAFRLLHRNAFGYDISTYAKEAAPYDVKKFFVETYIGGDYDWVISKDVFEHVPYEEIDDTLKNLSHSTRKMFCVIPLGQDGQYVVPAYELDSTHIIREDLTWWRDKFSLNGFQVESADYKVQYVKENWRNWERGNGFFILKSLNHDI